jgi:hypothetical protein
MSENTISLVALAIFLVSGFLWIKISDFFLSAVDVVHHSRFSYWIRKYISGFFVGLILAGVWLTLGVDLINTANNKTLNNTQPSSINKNSKNVQTSSTEIPVQKNKTESKQSDVGSNVIGIDCNSENKISKIICNYKDLIQINNKYQKYVSNLKSKNTDADLLKDF